MAEKGTKTGRRDLSPKARKTREVIGGNVNFPTETIRPGSLATKAGGEVISSDAYVKGR